MDCCLVLPVSISRKRFTSGSRLGYRPLSEDGFDESDRPVKVVVGKEKREFFVDPFVLDESPFRVLIEAVEKGSDDRINNKFDHLKKQREVFVDVDAILFEHMLWLVYNDYSSLFQINLREIVDFYRHDS